MEYLSQAVRAKAEECLAAVDDGDLSLVKRVKYHKPSTALPQPVLKLSVDNWTQQGIVHVALIPAVLIMIAADLATSKLADCA